MEIEGLGIELGSYGVEEYFSAVVGFDGLYSGDWDDGLSYAEVDAMEMGLRVGGLWDVLVSIGDGGRVVLYILRFGGVMDRVRFREDFRSHGCDEI